RCLADAVAVTSSVGDTVSESDGDDTNKVLRTPLQLGLGYWDNDGNPPDEIDALTVVDVPQPAAQVANTCQLSYDPLATRPGGELTGVNGSGRIGENVSLLFGPILN